MSTTIAQKHCRQTFDHAAHHWNYRWHSNPAERTDYCPGRYTPSAHRAPDPSPAQPADPFAGIPGAYED